MYVSSCGCTHFLSLLIVSEWFSGPTKSTTEPPDRFVINIRIARFEMSSWNLVDSQVFTQILMNAINNIWIWAVFITTPYINLCFKEIALHENGLSRYRMNVEEFVCMPFIFLGFSRSKYVKHNRLVSSFVSCKSACSLTCIYLLWIFSIF